MFFLFTPLKELSMKPTRFFRFSCLVSCILLAATTLFAQPRGVPAGNFPDFFYTVSPSRSLESDLVRQILAMPEFAEFFDAVTAKIDAEFDKASRQPAFPVNVTDYFLDKVRDAKGRRNISSKDVIELFFSEIELIQVEVFAGEALEASASVPSDMVPIVIGRNARLTFVTKFSPAELAGILDFIPPFITMEMFKAEESDFLVSFGVLGQPEMKLFIGGQKLRGRDDYVMVVSLDRERIEQKLSPRQSGLITSFLIGENAAIKSLRISRGFVEVLQAGVQKKIADGTANSGDRDFLRVLEQVNSFGVVTRDIDAQTTTRMTLTLTNEDTAEGLLAIALGGKAALRLLASSESVDADAKKLIDFVLNTEIVRVNNRLSASINWSSPEFVRLLQDGFKKATAEIKK